MLGMRKQGFVKWTIYSVIFFFAASIFFIGAASWFGNREAEKQRKNAEATAEAYERNPYQSTFDKLKKHVTDEEFSSALATIMVESNENGKAGKFVKKTLLTLKELAEYYIYLPVSMKMNFAQEEGKKNLLEKLIMEKLIIFDLKQKGIDVEAAIELRLSKMEKEYKEKNGISLRKSLEQMEGKSYNSTKNEMIMQLAAYKLRDVILSNREIPESRITEYFEKNKEGKYKGLDLKTAYYQVKFDAASDISDAEIKDYYSQHISRFKKKDTVGLYHILLNPDEYLSSVTANDKEIEDYYNRSKENFKTPVYADIRNILIKTDSEKVTRKIVETPEKISKYYNDNVNRYMSSKGIKIQYAYFKSQPDKIDLSRVTDEEAQTYFVEHKKDYETEGKVRASHILFPTDGMSEDEAEVIRMKADKILQEINAGGDFADLAKTHSSCPSKAKGGDLDWFIRGAMVKPFEDAAFNAEPGQVVGPVKTRFGYHIIKVTDKAPAENKSFDSVKEGIKEKIFKDDFHREQLAKVQSLKDKLSSKDDFTVFVRDNSEGRSKEFNGIAGYFYSGKSPELGDSSFKEAIKGELFDGEELHNILQKRLFKMETGEITEVLETPKGLFIVKMLESKEPAAIPLEKVADAVKADFRNEECDRIAMKIAEDIIVKLNEGVSFVELAGIWSDGRNAKNGGFLKKVPQGKAEEGIDLSEFEGEIIENGQVPYSVDKAIFSLKENEITQKPVKSELGYHVIRLDELMAQKIKPLEDVKAEIRTIIKGDKAKANALADAQSIQKELGNETTYDKFSVFVKKYSSAPSAEKGGKIGEVSSGQVQDQELIEILKNDKLAEMTLRNIDGQYQFGYFIDPQIEKTVFASPSPHQLVGPVSTKAGVHMFFVESVKSGEEIPLSEVREEIRNDLIMAVSEEELKKAYEQSKARFKQAGTVKCVHIMFDNEKDAGDAVAAIKAKKKTIEDYMSELKTGPLADYQLILGPDSPENLPKYILNTVEKMNIGDTSGVIENNKGFYVIKLLDRTQPSVPEFSQVAAEIERNMLNRKAQMLLMKSIEELRKKYGLKINENDPKLFSKLSVID